MKDKIAMFTEDGETVELLVFHRDVYNNFSF